MGDRAVCTVVVGEEAEELFAVSGPLMRQYADRVGASFHVLRWPGHPGWPMSAKFAIPRVFDGPAVRLAYFDADVLLRPGCVDVFAACHPDEFGACDELPFHRSQPQHRREADYRSFRRRHGFRESPLPWYFNAGVMVVPRCAAEYLLPPAGPIAQHHCAEQDHTNSRILDAFNAGKLRVRMLDRRCNWQNWTDWGFAEAPRDAILHLSGGGVERKYRAQRLAELARSTRPPPPAESREWAEYAICSTQRSGSTLLGSALEDAGLGRPVELLNHDSGCPKTLEVVRGNRCVKVHWYQLARHRLTSEPIFASGKYISLTRRDSIRQAVSLSRALKSGSWRSDQQSRRRAKYSRRHVHECLAKCAAEVAGWEGYYARHGIAPLRIVYEDLDRDYPGTVRRVLDYLGEYDRPVPPPAIARQADALTEEWVARFLAGD